MLKIRLLIISAILTSFSLVNNVIAEPTSLQKMMINENVTMMDRFLDLSYSSLKFFEDHEIDFNIETIAFPLKLERDENLIAKPSLTVGLDWDLGAWYISTNVSIIRRFINSKVFSYANGKSMCGKLLHKMNFLFLIPAYAYHNGFTRSTYDKDQLISHKNIGENTIWRAKLELTNIADNKHYKVKCEHAYEIEPTDYTYVFEGNWR
ncbi:MAG: hypothetical protein COB24_04745 [Hyphomicrobiales bacterium]|nr:MAG: hypothetical protein COB24_04745 [Hyphomicrobiales bacterium]